MTRALAILVAAFLLAGCGPQPRLTPQAVDGVLDLRTWNFEEDGPVSVTGTWDFYWKQLLAPGETGIGVQRISGIWNDAVGPDGKPVGAIGYGTYRLRVLLPHSRDRPDLAVRVHAVLMAHRLWLDHLEVPGGGIVSADPEQMRSASPNQFHVIPEGDAELQITLQVANGQFRMGGIRRPVQIGSVKDIFKLHTGQILYDSVILTFLLSAGSYFLLMFAARPRRNERYRLYFGLLTVVMGLRVTVAGDGLLAEVFWPGLPWSFQIVIEYAANFLGCALVPSMIASLYPDETPRTLLRVQQGVVAAMVAFVILAPVTMVVRSGPVFNFFVANGTLLMLTILVRAIRAGRESARLFLLSIFIFVLGLVLDILRSERILYSPVEVAPAAFALVILVQSLILARTFTRAFTANERLSIDLGIANEDLMLTNTAVQRFVPYEFLALLKRSSIREVARGDSAAMELEILFCDLREFTSIIEILPANEAFAFINEWLAYMEPAIHSHQGFVNQYMGDCIMALFASGADQAVRAGIEMLRALNGFNAQQNHVPGTEIRVGIGLNTGPILLGTIGGQDRLDNGIVGDAVNVAARVESMTKLYGTPFLITHLTRARLANPDAYALRELDIVAAKGKLKPITIYEVLDVLPADRQASRTACRREFSAGLDAYRRGGFQDAKTHFDTCLAKDPTDGPSQLYVLRCIALLEHPPATWEGISKLTEK